MSKFWILYIVVFILVSSVYYGIGYQQGQEDTIEKIHEMVSSGDSLIERK